MLEKNTSNYPLTVRAPGRVAYRTAWDAMRNFNATRSADTIDEIWLLEHPPVYTLGLNNKSATPVDTGIEIVQTDRGGQITYHGPGQLIVYTLLDLQRLGIGIKQLVAMLEQSVIDYLENEGISGHRMKDAPGVYVDKRKLAALGLRVRQQGSYHGLAVNIDMDLAPFSQIDPCGYEGLEVTDLNTLGINTTVPDVAHFLLGYLAGQLRYTLPPEPYLTRLP